MMSTSTESSARPFKTQFDPPARFYSEPGTRIKTIYGPKFDDRGVMYLTELGKHNLYAEIQSHAQSVDIHVLLALYHNGDKEALSRVQGAYGDFTEMPTTFAEALNAMIGAEQYFNSLPVEVKDRFGQSFHRFMVALDSPDFVSNMGLKPDVPEPTPVSVTAPIPSQASSPVPSPTPSSVDTVPS